MSGSENQKHGHVATIAGAPEPAQVVERLTKLSKAGKLAGFVAGGENHIASFAAFGGPFDGRVEITHSGHSTRFDLRMPVRMPIIFALVLVLCVWPGLPLTDAFLQGFGWYERLTSGALRTWMWYLPATVLPAPFALRSSIRKSRAAAYRHATETVERLRPKLTSDV
ncbi:MAG: hypothetical protein AAGA55_07500 [Planctomycetota bacterium]